eukprot:jgi/Ulvmu1/2145/UM129_0004.1
MIIYKKGIWGHHVLFRMYGSAFPRAMPHACISAGIAATLSALFNTTEWGLFDNSYIIQMFFFIAGFMVVFRSNLSYNRYWEGRTQLQQMTSKLTDAITTSLNFDKTAVPKVGATQEQIEEHKWFCDTFVHLISLFHGVALATLRGDYNMENVVVHDSLARAPPDNIHMLTKIEVDSRDSEDSAQLITGARGSPTKAAAGAQFDGANGKTKGGYSDLDHAAKYGYNTNEQLPRPAKSSKHSRHWAGTKSIFDYFVLRTSAEHSQHIYRTMKLPIIGGLTQAEGVALGAFITSGDTCTAVPDLNLGIHGVMLDNGTYAPAPTERVHTVASWIHQTLIERIHAGGVRASPPVQSRIHHSLADALVAFEQCQKLADTPFPFPWAQAINITLLVFVFAAPIAVVGFTSHVYVATVLTFMAVVTHVMLNEVARDIEDPFLYDPNELPLPQMQYKLNERLLAVHHSRRPIAFTDVGDLTGPGHTVHMLEGTQSEAQLSPEQMVNNAAFDTGGEGGGGRASVDHKDRIAAATGSQAVSGKDDPASATPATHPPSRNSASIHNGPNFMARSRSPPQASSAYMMSTADGMTVPLPQPSSQRSQRSERPTPSDAGDLREYSTANAVPIALSHQAMRWRSHAAGMHHVGSPSQGSIPSRRGGHGLHRNSMSNASYCGSVGGSSTYTAGWVGAPPVQHTESICTADGRQSMDNSRPLASISQRGVRPAAATIALSPQVSADAPPPPPPAAAAAAAAKDLDSADVINGSKSISFGVTKLQQVSSHSGLHSMGAAPRNGPLERAQRAAPAPSGSNPPLPGSAAQLLKADVQPVSVQGNRSAGSTSRTHKGGPSEEKAAQYAAIHAAREQGGWKQSRY